MTSHKRSYHVLLLLAIAALSAGCDRTQKDYFPLSGDGQWKYRTSFQKLDKTLHQHYIVANIGHIVMNNETAFVRQTVSGNRYYYRRSENGIQRIGEQAGEELQPRFYKQPVTILPLPLEPGNHWQTGSDVKLIESKTFEMRDRLYLQEPVVRLDYVIESLADSVTVPAGTWPDCLRVRGSGETTVKVNRGNSNAVIHVETIRWYAPGVGLVKSERSENSDSEFLKEGRYVMELEEYHP